MSRYEVHHEDKALAFGNDHACGEYLMIWDLSKGSMPEPENILVDEDRFTGLTRDKMEKLVKKHGFNLQELKEAKEPSEIDFSNIEF